jgi:hypothetical protein
MTAGLRRGRLIWTLLATSVALTWDEAMTAIHAMLDLVTLSACLSLLCFYAATRTMIPQKAHRPRRGRPEAQDRMSR